MVGDPSCNRKLGSQREKSLQSQLIHLDLVKTSIIRKISEPKHKKW